MKICFFIIFFIWIHLNKPCFRFTFLFGSPCITSGVIKYSTKTEYSSQFKIQKCKALHRATKDLN